MPGGLLQLTIVGEQNKYLTGHPKMTYFKYGYCQHTNFSMESIPQVFDGTIDFGQKVSATITRNGDLISDMMLEINIPSLTPIVDDDLNVYRVNWVNGIAYRIIEYVSIEIGGTEIDRHTGDWLYLKHELELSNTEKQKRNQLVHMENYFVFDDSKPLKCYVPLQFWFTKEIGNAIPLVSLQYHDVKIHVKFRNFEECVVVEKLVDFTPTTNNSTPQTQSTSISPTKVSLSGVKLYCDYIFLDKQERKWFAQTTHRYLIEQVQYNGVDHITSNEHKLQLNFNHPCKELVWYTTLSNKTQQNDWLNFGKSQNELNQYGSLPNDQLLDSATLFLNGHERISKRDADYFRLVTSNQYHSGQFDNYVYCYPFSLFPEKMQPSGALNFSIIDNAFMLFKNTKSDVEHDVHMYAINYNLLIVTQGMAGLAFSN